MFSKFQFSSVVTNPLSKLKASIKDMMTKQKLSISEIIPKKLFHISVPTSGNIESLFEEFKTSNQFQLWNISEYSYSEQILQKLLDGRQRNSDGRQIVYNLTYEYFASIPFCQMIKAIESIETFLSIHPDNKVYIHCQQNKRRSAIFLASYIFLAGIETDIVSSILKVNQMLNISMQDKQISENSPGSIYKSQHLVLKNIMNYINNSSFINKNAWNLRKLLINNAPKIHSILQLSHEKSSSIKFKVLLQIRSVEGISYKKIFHDQFIEGESLCLRIPQDEAVVLKDDFLIIIKYVYEKKGYSILRAQLNTNFIYDQFFRVQRNDMDLSVNNAHTKNQTVFMDLLFKQNQKQQSQLSQLNILKDGLEKQTANVLQNQMNENSKTNDRTQIDNTSQKEGEQDEEDGFGILDEEQEAVHNQKMQKEIEEELARELLNIRKKRNKQSKTIEEKIILQENKQPSLNSQQQNANRQTQNQSIVGIIQQTLGSDKKIGQIKELLSSKQKVESQNQEQEKIQDQHKQKLEVQEKEKEKHTTENRDQNKQNLDHSSSEQDSSQEQSSSDDQEQQEEEDLQDYLSKLQKQAEKHD